MFLTPVAAPGVDGTGGETGRVCGRYASSSTDADLRRDFFINTVVGEPLAASWNVAPAQPTRAVLTRPARPVGPGHGDTAAELEPAQRQLRTLHQGVVPSWAKDRRIGNRLVNARVETITEKPAFQARRPPTIAA